MSETIGLSMQGLIEDQDVRSHRDASQDLGATAAGLRTGGATRDEQVLQLVQRLFVARASAPQVLIFAGVEQGPACGAICAATAEVLAAAAPGSVCLIEASFDGATLQAKFGTVLSQGFADALRQDASVQSCAQRVSENNLWFMAAGRSPSGSVALISPERVKSCIAELRESFDFILLSCPPLSSHADALSLGRWADGLVLVLEVDETTREAAKDAVQSVRAAEIPILGAVLNRAKPTRKWWFSR